MCQLTFRYVCVYSFLFAFYFFFTPSNFLSKALQIFFFIFVKKLPVVDCFIVIVGVFVCGHCFQWCVDIFIFFFFLSLNALDFYSFIKRSMHPENEKPIIRRVLVAPILWIFDLAFLLLCGMEEKNAKK